MAVRWRRREPSSALCWLTRGDTLSPLGCVVPLVCCVRRTNVLFPSERGAQRQLESPHICDAATPSAHLYACTGLRADRASCVLLAALRSFARAAGRLACAVSQLSDSSDHWAHPHPRGCGGTTASSKAERAACIELQERPWHCQLAHARSGVALRVPLGASTGRCNCTFARVFASHSSAATRSCHS